LKTTRNPANRLKHFPVVMLTLLLCFQFLLTNVHAQTSSPSYSILFDEAHDQFYTYSNGRFTTALTYLNQTADFVVTLNSALFDNLTTLLTYDLIIIGNPGPHGNFSQIEIGVLKNYTLLGGNLLILNNFNDVANPSPDLNVTGHPEYLSNLTESLDLPLNLLTYDLFDETHIPLGQRWVVEIGTQNFQIFHPISWKINRILTFTSGLNVTSTDGIVATGYPESYLNNRTGDTLSTTPWLYATQQGASKIVICGSTAMFSDTNITNVGNSIYTGVKWINALDNLRLWANIIQWTSIKENPEFFLAFLIVSIALVALGIGLYLYNWFFKPPQLTSYELEIQNIKTELANTLKEARYHAKRGDFSAAAYSYKKASKLCNKLGDSHGEKQYSRKYREFLGKIKEK